MRELKNPQKHIHMYNKWTWFCFAAQQVSSLKYGCYHVRCTVTVCTRDHLLWERMHYGPYHNVYRRMGLEFNKKSLNMKKSTFVLADYGGQEVSTEVWVIYLLALSISAWSGPENKSTGCRICLFSGPHHGQLLPQQIRRFWWQHSVSCQCLQPPWILMLLQTDLYLSLLFSKIKYDNTFPVAMWTC